MEVYAEQSLSNPKIDKNKTKTKVLHGVRYFCIGVLFTLLAFVWMFPLVVGEGWQQVFFNVLTYFFIAIPFGFGIIVIKKIINRINIEYDYYLNGDEFRIVQIFNRSKRKVLIEAKCSTFESIGRVSSDTYDRYSSNKSVKKIISLCEVTSDEDIVYIYFKKNGEAFLLHIMPNQTMLNALKRCITRVSILDKSLSMTVKKNDIS